MVLSFFGLTSQYKKLVFDQIHDLVFHGGGGFLHSEVYNMPVWLRRFHIKKIIEFNKEQNEKIEQQRKGQQPNPSQVYQPNVKPPKIYNFKK